MSDKTVEYVDINIEYVKSITYSINWIYLRRTFRSNISNLWKWYCENWEIYTKKIEEYSNKTKENIKKYKSGNNERIIFKFWNWYCEKWNKIFNEGRVLK